MIDYVVADAMRKITTEHPIVNAGSFPMMLLWQIFEAAMYSEVDEDFSIMVDKMDDTVIENIFENSFPIFISSYPSILTLDN